MTDAEIMGVDIEADDDEVDRMRRAVGPTADRARVQGVVDTLRRAFGE